MFAPRLRVPILLPILQDGFKKLEEENDSCMQAVDKRINNYSINIRNIANNHVRRLKARFEAIYELI